MGLKENVAAIKEELSAEEQFLEGVIKAEGFFKRYKKLLIATGVILIVGFLVYAALEYKKEHDLTVSNEAYQVLQKNPSDASALAILKAKNPPLYTLFSISEAVKSGNIQKIEDVAAATNDPILKDLASYQVNILKNDVKKIGTYAQNQDALLS